MLIASALRNSRRDRGPIVKKKTIKTFYFVFSKNEWRDDRTNPNKTSAVVDSTVWIKRTKVYLLYKHCTNNVVLTFMVFVQYCISETILLLTIGYYVLQDLFSAVHWRKLNSGFCYKTNFTKWSVLIATLINFLSGD